MFSGSADVAGTVEEAAEVLLSAEDAEEAADEAEDVGEDDDEVPEVIFLSLVSVIPRRVALAFISSSESEGL